jgi:hypothetical protein
MITDTTDTTEITIEPVEGDDLYDHDAYAGRATGAWLWLDCASRTLSCRCASRDRTGMPAGVWHGLTLRWQLPALTADAANALMGDIADAAGRVCDGFERAWDGHNFVGRYDEDAREAQDEISRAIERREPWDPRDVIEPWDAADWLGALGGLARQGEELGIAADTTDDELNTIADRVEEEAAADGQRVRDVIEHLRRIARQLRDERDERDEEEA